jgi:hypothetical protein
MPEVKEVERLTAEILLQREPVVIRRGVEHWEAAQWTAETLARRFDNDTVWLTDFFAYGEDHDEDHIDGANGGEFFRSLVANNTTADGDGREVMAVRESSDMLKHPSLLRDLHFEGLVAGLPLFAEKYLWAAPKGTVTAVHADILPSNVLAHFSGEKEIVLFSPAQERFLYTTNRLQVDQAIYGDEDLDIEAPDLEEFPLFAQATPIRVVLQPLDLLYIPCGWFHHVRYLSACISVNALLYTEGQLALPKGPKECAVWWQGATAELSGHQQEL